MKTVDTGIQTQQTKQSILNRVELVNCYIVVLNSPSMRHRKIKRKKLKEQLRYKDPNLGLSKEK